MASWNSIPLEIVYQILGWTAFICWGLAGYPQLILNFRRKSVVGYSFDYVILNLTKQSSYLIYNVSLFFSPTVQRQYFEKYGYGQIFSCGLVTTSPWDPHKMLGLQVVSGEGSRYRIGVREPSSCVESIASKSASRVAVDAGFLLGGGGRRDGSLGFNPTGNHLRVLGSTSFICWGFSAYPQLILNFRRRSVVGLSFDYEILSLTKQSSYLIYNVSLFFSPTVQRQYFEKYGYGQMIPVAASDVFFSLHSVLLILIVLAQIAVFDRGNQKFSKISIAIVSAVLFFSAACFFIALPTHSWLWLVSMFNSIQVFMAVIKYSPQAFLNFTRKSTVGFSIGNIILDFTGGMAIFMQMTAQSIDQGSWVNFSGNIGKPLLALVSMFFDLIFFYQHFVLYRTKASMISSQLDPESSEVLIKDSDNLQGIKRPIDI